MSEVVTYRVADGVAEIVMNRPPMNAVNFEMVRAIVDAYHRARADQTARAVLLSSALPNYFSAGFDLKFALDMDGHDLRRFVEVFYYEMHEAQYRMGKPTIAAVTGHAIGAGFTWAVSCDMIVAAEEAKVGYPEINVGLLPAMHLVHLPRQIGRHRAAQLLFTGETIAARAMCEMGVINYVVPQAEVMPKARELAGKLALKSPIAMKLLRDSYMRANDLDYRRAIENVAESMINLWSSQDSREALRAFIEKRTPVYTGR